MRVWALAMVFLLFAGCTSPASTETADASSESQETVAEPAPPTVTSSSGELWASAGFPVDTPAGHWLVSYGPSDPVPPQAALSVARFELVATSPLDGIYPNRLGLEVWEDEELGSGDPTRPGEPLAGSTDADDRGVITVDLPASDWPDGATLGARVAAAWDQPAPEVAMMIQFTVYVSLFNGDIPEGYTAVPS